MNFPNDAYAIVQVFRCAMSGQIAGVRIQVYRICFDARCRDAFFCFTAIRFFGWNGVLLGKTITVKTFDSQLDQDSFLYNGLFKDLFIGMNFAFFSGARNGVPGLLRMVQDVVCVSPFGTRPFSVFFSNFCVLRVFFN